MQNLQEKKGKNIFIDGMFFNVYAMEKAIKQDSFLSQEFEKRQAKKDLYGYHSNENILNELFRFFILPKSLNPDSLSYKSVMDTPITDETKGDENYNRFNLYKGIRTRVESFKKQKQQDNTNNDNAQKPMLANEKPQIANEDDNPLEETTVAAGSTGQYTSKYFVSSNKEEGNLSKGKSFLPQGTVVIKPNNKKHDSGVDSYKIMKEDSLKSKEEKADFISKANDEFTYKDILNWSDVDIDEKYDELKNGEIGKNKNIIENNKEVQKELKENEVVPALVQLKRVQAENPVNFKNDNEKAQKKALNAVIGKENEEITIGPNLDNDPTALKDEDIPKRKNSPEEDEDLTMIRRGVEDFEPDLKPSEKYLEMIKKNMEVGGQVGKDRFEAMQKRVKAQHEMPMYNKDKQPVEESILAPYYDKYGKKLFVEFYLDDVKYLDKVDENYIPLNSNTMVYSLTESIEDILSNLQFYFKDNQVYTTKKEVLNESKGLNGLNKMKHLFDYNPKEFITPNKKVKK